MPSILNDFLAANLLPIGDDDDKLHRLEEAAKDLSKRLDEAPILVHRFALVGAHEDVSATDPVCGMVGAAVTTRWQTMGNRVGPGPVQIFRAVALRAIEIAADDNPEVSHAAALVLSHESGANGGGSAERAIRELALRLDEVVGPSLLSTWATPIDLAPLRLPARPRKPATPKEDLSLALSRASGPTDKTARAVPGANPHWPNAGEPWVHEFVPRATEALHAAIQAGAKSSAEDLADHLRDTVSNWSHALQLLSRRDAKAELLWIRMSLYSPSARKRFSELKGSDTVLHSILDVSRAVPGLAPESVESFLRELVASQTNKQMRLSELLVALGPKLQTTAEGKAIANTEVLPPIGRRGWLDLAVRGGDSSFEEATGVASTFRAPISELSVSLYRELQIRKLLATTS